MKKKSSIAIIAPYPFLPAQSGGQKAIFAYIKALLLQFNGFVISTFENEASDDFELVKLFPDRPWKYFSPLVALKIRRTLQQRGVKVLVLQHHYMALLLYPFLIGLGIKTFVFSHNLEFQRWRSIGKWWWPLMYLTEWWVYQLSNYVCFISLDEKEKAPTLFGLAAQKCLYAPYLIEQKEAPKDNELVSQKLKAALGIPLHDRLLLFFGPQSYLPNLEAVKKIVFDINPILQKTASFSYKILICGGGLPAEYQRFEDQQKNDIRYLGFVEDIEKHILASDLILNPVNMGGGVKTKLVEAIGMDKTVISTVSGAKGIDLNVFGEKLLMVADDDWTAFANCIIQVLNRQPLNTSSKFYNTHSIYGNGMKEIEEAIKPNLS